MTELQISLEPAAGLERRLRIQVPALQIDQEVETRLRKAGRNANIKGFRRGKVPAQVIRQRFGAQIREEVLQDVMQRSYSEAIAREKLRPAGNPRIEAQSPPAVGEDLAYTAIVEVYPEFQLAGVEQLRIEKPAIDVTEEDIDRMIERLRHQNGSWEPAARPAASGDRVTVDFDGRLHGEALEGGSAEKMEIVLGEGRMLPDFEANLAGLEAGGSKSFNVRFPDDYHRQNLRGEQVTFDVRVGEVAARALPVVDAAFVTNLGIESGEVAELRRRVRENLEREVAARVRAEMRRQVIDQVLASNPVAVPEVLVSREAASLQAQAMRKMGIENVADAPDASTYRPVAERRVRLGLIIGALVREQDLKLDEALVDSRLDELCRQFEEPGQVKRLYLQNPELMSQIENSVIEDQAMSWLVERAAVTEKKQALAELVDG